MNVKTIHTYLLGVLLLFAGYCHAQTDSLSTYHSFFIEPEVLFGQIVPNYNNYPVSNPRETIDISLGSSNVNNKPWAKYYNHPDVGCLFSFTHLGNPKVYGNEIDIMPFIGLNTQRRLKHTWYFKLGLGASYFTKHYNASQDSLNLAIGAEFTWAFRVFLYRVLYVNKNINLRICGGYCHSSDGHTQLPNFGLNSAVLGLSMQINSHPLNPDFMYPENEKAHAPRIDFVQFYSGVGMHERGGPSGPIGGSKYIVYSTAFSGGIIFNNHLKVRTGLTFRDYGKLMDFAGPTYANWHKTSDVFFSIGCEFWVGHVGMDIEGGITLYKPFYRPFYKKYEGNTQSTWYFLKSVFPVRLGINYYVLNPYRNKHFNVFAGAHVNANFGQADYSELSLGCTMRLRH